MRRLTPEETTLVVVDVQDKLAAAMPAAARIDVERATTVLLAAAAELGAPVLATEQYPVGLGATVAPVAAELDRMGVARLPKVEFSACDAPGFAAAWARRPTRAAVVVGMEAHVCVFQTVRDLAARGLDVHVVADGVASRREDHRQVGLDLCRAAGATVTTMETVVFDWLRRAGSSSFKALSKRIR